jgi:hypothetical protein
VNADRLLTPDERRASGEVVVDERVVEATREGE